jgi:hypothetical protein
MLTKAAFVIYKLTGDEDDTFPYIFKNLTELKDENLRYNPGMLYLYQKL